MDNTDIKNNYDLVQEKWQENYLTWDVEKIVKNLGIGGYTPEALFIHFYGEEFRIDNTTGLITKSGESDWKSDFNTVMSIYNLLYYSVENPKLTNQWVPFRDVKRAAPFAPAFQKVPLEAAAKFFNGHARELDEAGQKLDFQRISYSEVGFEARAFDCLPIRFLFWDGDEEFPAQFNILFDYGITDFMHEETVVLLAQAGVNHLMEASGLKHSI